MSLFAICKWLQETSFGTALRESVWAFIVVESIHVLALSVSVGTIIWLDLRLAGLTMMNRRASSVMGSVIPWSIAGFLTMFVTGVLLFWCQAVKAYNSIFFSIKLVFLFLACVNALVFQLTAYKQMEQWDSDRIPPLRARLAAWTSLLLWLGVIVAGRTMAYTF